MVEISQNRAMPDHIGLYGRDRVLYQGSRHEYTQAPLKQIIINERVHSRPIDEQALLVKKWIEIKLKMELRGAGHEEYNKLYLNIRNDIRVMESEDYPRQTVDVLEKTGRLIQKTMMEKEIDQMKHVPEKNTQRWKKK